MKRPPGVVLLVAVDDTLLDNDRIAGLGYRDYLGAVQRVRLEHPEEPRLLTLASFLLDYPFAERLYPRALEALPRPPRPNRDPQRR